MLRPVKTKTPFILPLEKIKTTGVNSKESRGVSHPPLCGIIRLTNFNV